MDGLASYKLEIVLILTIGFTFASLLGYLSVRCRLSPILGYLVAGYLIGPYSPGFVANIGLTEQLAEIGVILMMFGVGMHFKWQDLSKVRGIASVGALVQTIATTLIGMVVIHSIGWALAEGLIVGLAIGVASTVVLVRVLEDHNLLMTQQGHIAIGWLLVEDMLTVLALSMLPVIASVVNVQQPSFDKIFLPFLWIIVKLVFLLVFMFTIGLRLVKHCLFYVSLTRSRELFTVSVLALMFAIATATALFFGISIALGAFIAGMVIGCTNMREQASTNALPLQDVFVVLFFLTIGMLFNPSAMWERPSLFLMILAIILIVKPLIAYLIVRAFGYPLRIALTLALALAQVGEFSFILTEEAMRLKIFPDDGYDLIVAAALCSIALNPLLFRWIAPCERWLTKDEVITLTSIKQTPFSPSGWGP